MGFTGGAAAWEAAQARTRLVPGVVPGGGTPGLSRDAVLLLAIGTLSAPA